MFEGEWENGRAREPSIRLPREAPKKGSIFSAPGFRGVRADTPSREDRRNAPEHPRAATSALRQSPFLPGLRIPEKDGGVGEVEMTLDAFEHTGGQEESKGAERLSESTAPKASADSEAGKFSFFFPGRLAGFSKPALKDRPQPERPARNAPVQLYLEVPSLYQPQLFEEPLVCFKMLRLGEFFNFFLGKGFEQLIQIG